MKYQITKTNQIIEADNAWDILMQVRDLNATDKYFLMPKHAERDLAGLLADGTLIEVAEVEAPEVVETVIVEASAPRKILKGKTPKAQQILDSIKLLGIFDSGHFGSGEQYDLWEAENCYYEYPRPEVVEEVEMDEWADWEEELEDSEAEAAHAEAVATYWEEEHESNMRWHQELMALSDEERDFLRLIMMSRQFKRDRITSIVNSGQITDETWADFVTDWIAPNTFPPKGYLTAQQATDKLIEKGFKIGESTIRVACQRGQYKSAQRVGRDWLINWEEVAVHYKIK